MLACPFGVCRPLRCLSRLVSVPSYRRLVSVRLTVGPFYCRPSLLVSPPLMSIPVNYGLSLWRPVLPLAPSTEGNLMKSGTGEQAQFFEHQTQGS